MFGRIADLIDAFSDHGVGMIPSSFAGETFGRGFKDEGAGSYAGIVAGLIGAELGNVAYLEGS
jgi:hypothetical protein